MAKKIPCVVLKTDPFVERRQNPNRKNNKYRRNEDLEQKGPNLAPAYVYDDIGWLGIDRKNFDVFCTGLAIDYYA